MRYAGARTEPTPPFPLPGFHPLPLRYAPAPHFPSCSGEPAAAQSRSRLIPFPSTRPLVPPSTATTLPCPQDIFPLACTPRASLPTSLPLPAHLMPTYQTSPFLSYIAAHTAGCRATARPPPHGAPARRRAVLHACILSPACAAHVMQMTRIADREACGGAGGRRSQRGCGACRAQHAGQAAGMRRTPQLGRPCARCARSGAPSSAAARMDSASPCDTSTMCRPLCAASRRSTRPAVRAATSSTLSPLSPAGLRAGEAGACAGWGSGSQRVRAGAACRLPPAAAARKVRHARRLPGPPKPAHTRAWRRWTGRRRPTPARSLRSWSARARRSSAPAAPAPAAGHDTQEDTRAAARGVAGSRLGGVRALARAA